jgi:transmembrane sensor
MAGEVRHLNSVHEDAAVWISRIERGLSTVEQDQFSAWIAEDPEHAEILARQSAILADVQSPAFEQASAPEAQAPVPQETRTQTGWTRRAMMAAGALAASLLVVLGVYATAGDPVASHSAAPVRIASANTIQSEALADGSTVWLDARTTLELDFSDAERRVSLQQGGVFAEVAHDAERPFVVTAGTVSVTAVGTAFEVQARNGSLAVRVEEGIVRIADAATGDTVLLEAGSALLRRADGGWGQPEPVEMNAVAEWRTGRLRIQSEPVEALARRLNLYREAPILIDGEALSDLRVSGVFSIRQDDADAMALALADSVEACAVPQPTGAIVITRNTMLCP